ncbi:MAG: M48 family metalloprotease [Rhodobacteraceae bacterium]|nr:M48 family metalloprotease [Paracoccaceae bacterium]
MKKAALIILLAFSLPTAALASMDATESGQETKKSAKSKKKKPKPITTAKAKKAIANFKAVAAKVEPIGEQICRSFHKNKPRKTCDFLIKVNNDGNQKANAFQSLGKDGRPVITFNINKLLKVRNNDEIVFVLGHEFGHQIAQHIQKTRIHQEQGMLLGNAIYSDDDDKDKGKRVGKFHAMVTYSKEFELEADVIAVHITDRAGFDAGRGSRDLKRLRGGSSQWYSTHPPSPRRIQRVKKELGKIRAAKARGKVAPIVW